MGEQECAPAMNPFTLNSEQDQEMNTSPTPLSQPMSPQLPQRPKRRAEAEFDSEPEVEVKCITKKLRKLTHSPIPSVPSRHVFIRMQSELVRAKKILVEPWGVMVELLEGNELAQVEKGARYWGKWDGSVTAFQSVPILDAVHAIM